jgi:hypothetical protein
MTCRANYVGPYATAAGEGGDAAGVTQVSRTTLYPATGDGEGDGAFSSDRQVVGPDR